MSRRRRLLLLSTAGVVLLLVLAGLAVLRSRGGDDVGPRPDQAVPGTVVLVPGYGGSRTALERLAGRLERAGRTAQADTLDAAVRDALGGGASSVDIVGYSAGGVVARLWVDRHDGARTARRVVTLGSPLHGAQLAAVGAVFAPGACPPACRQLAPGSAVLRAIDEGVLPAGLPWLSIWTENDETVQPPDSARLDGAVNLPLQSICPGARVAHGDLPTDPRVSALVLAAVGTDPLTAPTTCPT